MIKETPQALAPKNKNYTRTVREYAFVIIGSFFIGISFVFFFEPFNIIPGGIYGVGIVIHHIFPSIAVSTAGFLLDIPLLITAFLVLGYGIGTKTIIGFLATPGSMMLLKYLIRQNPSINPMDPLSLGDDTLIACVFGAIILGVGLGLIFKSRATSGGTDIVAMILTKYVRIPLSRSVIIVDSLVILLGLIAFGDWRIPMYSLLSLYVLGQVLDMVLKGFNYDSALLVISKKNDTIAATILNDLDRGATFLKGKGAYSKEDKDILFTVINRREIPILEKKIHDIDSDAFVTNIDTREILGEGFNSLTEKMDS